MFGKVIVRGMVCIYSCNNNLFVLNDIVYILIKYISRFILLYFDKKNILIIRYEIFFI